MIKLRDLTAFPVILICLLLPTYSQAQSIQTLLKQADTETDSLKAISLYTRLLERDATVSAAYFGRAVVRRRAGQLVEAITDMGQAIQLEPQRADYYAQRAYLYLLLNEYDRAARDARQAVTLAPEKADFYSTLSYCQTKQGRYDEAEKTAQRGIDLSPASPFSYRNRGRARLYKGQIEAAIADFQSSLQRNHREPFRVYCDLGEAYQRKKQFKESLTYYNKALAQRPDYIEAIVLKRQLELLINARSSLPASTFTGRRVALVIGNSTYQTMSKLGGQPVNDALAMKARLSELGFMVDALTDADYATTQTRLSQFYISAKGADVALLFFAGHGIEFLGTNYLLPIDFKLDQQHPDNTEDRAYSVATLIDKIQAVHPRYCILMLDACRSNPFDKNLTISSPTGVNSPSTSERSQTSASSSTLGRGGRVSSSFNEVDFESKILNCLVALATATNHEALNGPNRNGYYTEAMLKVLRRGRRLDEVLKEVRAEVMEQTQKTGNLQQPEYIAKTTEDIIF